MTFDFVPFVRYVAKSTYFIHDDVIAKDCRLLYILSGKGAIEIAGEQYALCPNTLVYFPYGFSYRISADVENVLLFYTLNFDFFDKHKTRTVLVPQSVHRHQAEQEIHSISKELLPCFGHPLYFTHALWAENDLRAIYSEALHKQEGFEDMQSAHLKVLLLHLFRNHIGTRGGHPLCDTIKAMVQKDPATNNQALAKDLNYHPFYINELFKKHEGMTLHRYIMQQRLCRAYESITATSDTLDSIASACGFCSQAHFSTAFKQAYGVSPGSLRKQT